MPSLLPGDDQTKAEMCEECITPIELNAHQSNLSINFLLLSRTFYHSVLPIKRPTAMVSVDIVRFQGKVLDFF